MEQNEFSIFSEREVKYGGFWIRFGASFIDSLIVGFIFIIIAALLPSIFLKENSELSRILSFYKYISYSSLGNFLNVVFGWLYYALQESGPNQATLGKRALQLKVTDMNGHRISFGKATGRHFGKWLSALILLIGYIMAAFDSRKQALHDKMAGTLVVSTD